MGEYRLRNHIPLGAPGTREPFLGDEPPLRVSLGFTPRWYRDRLGIDFGELWHEDPHYRYVSLLSMKELLHGKFPEVDHFTPRFEDRGAGKDRVEPSCATVSGVRGIMLVPSLYGLPIAWREDNWPDAQGGAHLPKETLQRLEPFNEKALGANPAAASLFAQMEEIGRRWGRISGYLNYQGILNISLKLRGNDIFTDLIDDPPFAHGLFRHVAGTIATLSSMVQRRQRASGFEVDLLSLSNCVMNMVSPAHYEEFVLPLDGELSTRYPRFGVHTCNWKIDAYLSALRRIGRMGYIDTGMSSDLARVKALFPDARRAVLYGPGDAETRSLREIGDDMARLAREYAPCDIVLADVETTMPDGRIREFLALAREHGRTAARA